MDIVYKFYKTEHFFYRIHMLPIAILIRAFMRIVFACDILYKAEIGKNTCFPYDGLGVVIHPDVKIGENCHINQNITTGGKSNLEVLPAIGDNVTLGAGSIILGNIVIGNNATVGAGAVVVKDVPDNATVAGVPAVIIKIDGENSANR